MSKSGSAPALYPSSHNTVVASMLVRKAAVGQRRRHAYGTVTKINKTTKSQPRAVYR